ncbi:MAG: GNAT family N-acetyltransferase [Chloroflexi bacterium]|nr:GNAT family N-acetyltransferase [Chloroflexota bacterium]
MTLSRTASPSPGSDPQSDVHIRQPRLEFGDGGAMWRLARESGVLEENAEYTYHMFTHYFGEASVVAERDGEAVGFIAGFRPPDHPDTAFVWQIAVDQSARGQGLARMMIHGLLQRLAPDVRYLEATVSPRTRHRSAPSGASRVTLTSRGARKSCSRAIASMGHLTRTKSSSGSVRSIRSRSTGMHAHEHSNPGHNIWWWNYD